MFLFRLKRTTKLGFKSLWMHKLRSSLTTLGIIFGVSSVIAMLAIGEGASQESAVVGETPNLAARLVSLKPVGSVWF